MVLQKDQGKEGQVFLPLIHGLCALVQAALDTCLDSPFFASLSVHGLHFAVYAFSRRPAKLGCSGVQERPRLEAAKAALEEVKKTLPFAVSGSPKNLLRLTYLPWLLPCARLYFRDPSKICEMVFGVPQMGV